MIQVICKSAPAPTSSLKSRADEDVIIFGGNGVGRVVPWIMRSRKASAASRMLPGIVEDPVARYGLELGDITGS